MERTAFESAKPRLRGLAIPTILTGALAALLVTRYPLAEALPYWFWTATVLPRPDVLWILPILLGAVGAVAFVHRTRLPPWITLAVLCVLGTAFQFGFAAIEGRGVDGVRDRILKTGHSLFAVEAVKQPSMWQVATKYQAMVDDGRLSFYPNGTKPPGQLLFYMLTERAAQWLPVPGSDPLQRTANLATAIWPVLSYLCLVPLYWLARLAFDERHAFVPCLLYLGIPSHALVTLHLDEVLYPTLFLTPMALFLYGLRDRRRQLMFVAGIATSLAMFVSFSLVAIAPLLCLVLVVDLSRELDWRQPSARGNRQRVAAAIRLGLFYLLGLVAIQACLFGALDYSLIDNYQHTMAAHQSWKIKAWDGPTMLYIGLIDLLEFAVWTGPAIICLALGETFGRLRRPEPAPDYRRTLVMAFIPVLLLLAFGSKTVAETARLWLFLAGLVAMFAAGRLIERNDQRVWTATGAIVALQLTLTFVLKRWLDFY